MNKKEVDKILRDTAYVRVSGTKEEKRCAEYICDKCRKNTFSTIVKDAFYETGTPKPISIISLSVLATMRYIISARQERFWAFALGESEHQMFFDVCEKYLLNQLERGFYSLDFYKSLL